MPGPEAGLGDEPQLNRAAKVATERLCDLLGVKACALDVGGVRQGENGRRALGGEEPAHGEHGANPGRSWLNTWSPHAATSSSRVGGGRALSGDGSAVASSLIAGAGETEVAPTGLGGDGEAAGGREEPGPSTPAEGTPAGAMPALKAPSAGCDPISA